MSARYRPEDSKVLKKEKVFSGCFFFFTMDPQLHCVPKQRNGGKGRWLGSRPPRTPGYLWPGPGVRRPSAQAQSSPYWTHPSTRAGDNLQIQHRINEPKPTTSWLNGK